MTSRNTYQHLTPTTMSVKVPAIVAGEFDDLAMTHIKSRSELLREAILEKLVRHGRRIDTMGLPGFSR